MAQRMLEHAANSGRAGAGAQICMSQKLELVLLCWWLSYPKLHLNNPGALVKYRFLSPPSWRLIPKPGAGLGMCILYKPCYAVLLQAPRCPWPRLSWSSAIPQGDTLPRHSLVLWLCCGHPALLLAL